MLVRAFLITSTDAMFNIKVSIDGFGDVARIVAIIENPSLRLIRLKSFYALFMHTIHLQLLNYELRYQQVLI